MEAESKESLKAQVAFFEGILAEDINFVDALIPLGDAYTKLGDYEKGLDVDIRLSKLLPDDATVFYNLACSHSLLGDVERAYEALGRSIRLGYDDLDHMLNDSDLSNVIGDDNFPEFLERAISEAKSGKES